jgi:hypothetical protein
MTEQIERERDLAWAQHLAAKAKAAGNEHYVTPHPGGAAWYNAKAKAKVTPTPATTTPLHRRLNAEERAAYLLTRHDRPEEAVGVAVYWPNCWTAKHGTIIGCTGNGYVKVRFSDNRETTVKVDFLTVPPAESAAA